jgi:hypothetical protein
MGQQSRVGCSTYFLSGSRREVKNSGQAEDFPQRLAKARAIALALSAVT